MSAPIFARTLASAAMIEVFADRAVIEATLAFEAALADAEAAEGVIPSSAVAPIAAACRGEFDIEAIVAEARPAGSLAIPLVKRLTVRVAEQDAAAAAFVHRGSTSQDVIDTAMVLVTRRALALIEVELARLTGSLLALARAHVATPMLARTLLQPAQVISFGVKVATWVAPLVRGRERLARAGAAALQLQFGGAVGTLASLVHEARQASVGPEGVVVLRPDASGALVERIGDGEFRLVGRDVERVVALNDVTTPEALSYIDYRLERLGVPKMLAKAGAQEGDVIWIGEFSFDYQPDL